MCIPIYVDIYICNSLRHCKTAHQYDFISLHWPAVYKNSLCSISFPVHDFMTFMCAVESISSLICVFQIANHFKTFLLVFISHLQFLFFEWPVFKVFFVITTFIRQLDQAKECPESWQTFLLGMSVNVFVEEIKIELVKGLV